MNPAQHIVLQTADWLNVFGHYMLLSLLSIGGAITTTSDMHRYLVDQHHWVTDPQFNAAIALAQAAPGPNVLFVALMGWNLGLNAGGLLPALFGVLVTMIGILLPSTTITFIAARWGHANRDLRSVRAFKQGMAPIVVGLLFATSWVLANGNGDFSRRWAVWLVTGIVALIIWRTRIHILWLLAAGALLGWFGLV
jgi:chromate transporter